MKTSVKWLHFICSIAILGALTAYFYRIAIHGTFVPGLFGFFFVSWAACLPATIIILLLRLFLVIGRSAFIYVFLGISCFYLGNVGLFWGIGDIKRDALWVALYTFTIVISMFILVDAFILELPGIRSSKQAKQ